MANLPSDFKKGDRLSAATMREILRLAKLGAKPIRVVENSGLTLRDDASGRVLGIDARRLPGNAKSTSETRFGYVTQVEGGSSPQEVLVQFLKPVKNEPTGDPPTYTWSWQSDGDARVAGVPPNFAGVDFDKLKRTAFTNTTPVVRCDRVEGRWVLSLVPRWAYRALPEGVTVTRCQ